MGKTLSAMRWNNAAVEPEAAFSMSAAHVSVTHMTIRFDTPEHLAASPRLSGFNTHASGPVIALRKELSSDKKKYVTHAWSVEHVGDELTSVQLTHDQHGLTEVCPAADGGVFFTSSRPAGEDDKEQTRLWLLPPHGEARMILERRGDVENLKLAGERLFFVSGTLPAARHAEDVTAENERLAKLREDSGASAVLYETAPTRDWDHDLGPDEPTLWFVSARDAIDGAALQGRARQVRLPRGRLLGFEPAPDGSFVVVTVNVWIEGGWERSEVWRVSTAEDGTGEPELLRTADKDIWWEARPISPDGRRIILLKEQLWNSAQNLSMSLWVHDVEAQDAREILPGDEYWGEDPQWVDDSTVVCSADYRGRGIVLRVSCAPDEKPSVEVVAGGDGQGWTYRSVQVTGDRLWAVRSRMDRPEELVYWPADGYHADPARVEGILPDGVPAGRLEEVTTVAEDGTEIRAWLALPDAPAAEELPLLVFVHGGPWASNNAWSWRWNPWPFVARGYAVLLPDPAISTGYGQHMIDRGQQELGGTPFTDVMALVEATTQRQDIDSERQALLGGSYGGYMANWVAGHTGKRFRCIVTHASLWDLNTMGSTTDNTVWEEAMAPQQADQYSPHRFVSDIEVPVLVIHGDKDYRVPISQGLQLWSDLQRHTAVEGHKFLYFPDENHWILKPANSRTWYETVLAFVDEHVRDTPWRRPELLG